MSIVWALDPVTPGTYGIYRGFRNFELGNVEWYFRLFQNDYTPVAGSLTADFTVADFDGYEQQGLTGGGGIQDWTATASMVTFHLSSDDPYFTWTKTAGSASNTIYGVYVVDQNTAGIIFAERFDSPVLMQTTGDVLKYLFRLPMRVAA